MLDLFDEYKGTFDEANLLSAEAIADLNNTDFRDGDIGEWAENTDGSGTCAYDFSDIGGADDKQGKLTSDADSYLYADLQSAYWNGLGGAAPNPDTLYKMTANVYIPADNNTLKDIKIFTYGFDEDYTVEYTLVDATWTPIVLWFYLATDVVGAVRIGFDGDPTNGDILFFDDISIKEVDISWVPYGSNVMSIDSDALKFEYKSNSGGAYLALKDANDLSADLVVGKRYTVTGRMKVAVGEDAKPTVYRGIGGQFAYGDVVTSTAFVSFVINFIAGNATTCYLSPGNMSLGETAWLDSLEIHGYGKKTSEKLLGGGIS